MRKQLSSFLIVTMLAMSVAPATYAQEIGGTGPEEAIEIPETILKTGSWMTCHKQGEEDAHSRSTSGSGAAGLACGVLLGLIGTGLAVLAQTKSEPSSEVMASLDGATEECQYSYLQAFEDESVRMKRKAALIGGLIGTVVIVGVYFATGGELN